MTYPAFCVDYPEKKKKKEYTDEKSARLGIKTNAVTERNFILYVATTVLTSYLLETHHAVCYKFKFRANILVAQ